jgi:hypothetical protein
MTEIISKNAEEGWATFDDFTVGIATNRLPNTNHWVGKELKIEFENNKVLELAFGEEKVKWSWDGEQDEDVYEEVCTSPDHYFFDIYFSKRANETLTIVMNTQTRRVISVRCIMRDKAPEGDARVAHEFLVGVIQGGTPSGEVPGPTRELIGYRSLNEYSPNLVWEHFYVNSKRYAWQGIKGVSRGLGDMDYATAYKLEENMYVFAFREKIVPCGSVFFFDYNIGRCTGKFIGITDEGKITNTKAGAKIWKTSYNCYPPGYEPI